MNIRILITEGPQVLYDETLQPFIKATPQSPEDSTGVYAIPTDTSNFSSNGVIPAPQDDFGFTF